MTDQPRGTWGTLVTAAAPVVSLDLAKQHCRIDATDDHALIAQWIDVATRMVEIDSGTRLLTQTWDVRYDRFPCGTEALVLPAGPVQSISSVKYYDSATPSVEQTMLAASYVVDTVSRPARVGLADGQAWPTGLRGFQPITVRGVFGWTAETLPARYVQAVLLLVAHYSEARQAVDLDRHSEVPMGYWHLLDRVPACV